MNITPLNLNFTARLKRTLSSQYNCPGTKADMEESFDFQIKKIREQKAAAVEFDNFMRSDEIKGVMKQLPKDASIEMFNSFELSEDPRDVDDCEPFSLTYIKDSEACDEDGYDGYILYGSECGDIAFHGVQKRDGSIDKDGIKNWLNTLVSLFSDNSKN